MTRPHCSACGVDMWLTRIGSDARREAYHFECKACGAQHVVLAGHDNMKIVEDRL